TGSGRAAPVAVFVLLAAPAGAGGVAADLLLGPDGGGGTAAALLCGGRPCASRRRGRGDPYRLVGRVVDGRRAGGPRAAAAVQGLVRLDLDPEEELGDVQADVRLHLLEEVEALEGVLLQRVALAVAAQADALAEHVHAVQVLLPVLIDDLKDD